jgi:ParB family chromosome partitioning protein
MKIFRRIFHNAKIGRSKNCSTWNILRFFDEKYRFRAKKFTHFYLINFPILCYNLGNNFKGEFKMSVQTLLRKKSVAENKSVEEIAVEKIFPNRSQPRNFFSAEDLTAMAKSISQVGILQPLTVRQIGGGNFELIAGERRLRAAKIAGLKNVPCIIENASDEQSALMALTENLQRQNLNFFEEAAGYRMLLESCGMTQQQAAIHLGIAQPTLANKLRLLKLSEEHRDFILNNSLTERHARALLRVKEEQRGEVLQVVCERQLTADGMERYIDSLIKREKVRESYRRRSAALKDVRLFFNTVEKALGVMRLAGVEAQSERKQCDGYIEYLIKIPKKD